MKRYVYSIKDQKTGFLNPTFEISDAVAKRNFEHAVASAPESLFTSHPEDYALYCIGAFDTDTGLISPLPQPGLILEARSVLAMRGDRDGN